MKLTYNHTPKKPNPELTVGQVWEGVNEYEPQKAFIINMFSDQVDYLVFNEAYGEGIRLLNRYTLRQFKSAYETYIGTVESININTGI